jgi:hypothetical protein
MRLAFYYPWFPRNWTQKDIYPYSNYVPCLDPPYYDSADPATIRNHIDAMQYGNIDGGIASWWGQGSEEDRNLSKLLDAAKGGTFKWCAYYELENSAPPITTIESDLKYIQNAYASHPNYLKIDGRFVVFVYTDIESNGPNMAYRWKQANTVNAFIVLKVFPNYAKCPQQPDSWHQYDPAWSADSQKPYSYTISPGFWKKGEPERLNRDLNRWKRNIREMAASKTMFQLITTFNEHGEGTTVECCRGSQGWESKSGYGTYLDALHLNGKR